MSSASHNHALNTLVRELEGITHPSDAERQAVLSLPVRIQDLPPRQDIARQGDRPSQCCLLLEGWVCRYKLLSEGRRQILSFHIPSDTPDLHSLHIRTMDHSLATVTRARVALIPHGALRNLSANFPNIAALLWRDTLVDAAIFREWMIGIGRRSAYGRIAHLFCEMYAKQEAAGLARGRHCPLPLTQADLADALGLTSVHINRTLQTLRSDGLVTLRNHTLIVDRWDDLIEAAEFDPTYLHLDKPPVGNGPQG